MKVAHKKLALIAALTVGIFLVLVGNTAGEDFKSEYGLGLVPSEGDFPALDTSYLTQSIASLPASVDLSDRLPPVGHQGAQGSCVGWALGYYYKTFQEVEERGWDVSLPEQQFSPAWIYNQRPTSDCSIDSGMSFWNGLSILQNQGAATLVSFPYDSHDSCTQPSQEVQEEAWQYRIERFENIYCRQGTADIQALKALLANGDPFAIAVPVYRSFYSVTSTSPVVPRHTEGETFFGGHALFVVGYDDNIGGFKAVNSWGSYWGQDGYCYLSYDFVQYDSWESWVMEDYLETVDESTVDLHLSTGWNLVSLPLRPGIDSFTELVGPISNDLEGAYVWDADAQRWRRYVPSLPAYTNSLQQFDPTTGIWMRVYQDTVLSVRGTAWGACTIALNTGWNLVGYPIDSAKPALEALSSIEGKYTDIYTYRNESGIVEWDYYYTVALPESNTLREMRPGSGYWIHVIEPCTWTIPLDG